MDLFEKCLHSNGNLGIMGLSEVPRGAGCILAWSTIVGPFHESDVFDACLLAGSFYKNVDKRLDKRSRW